jgi:hypothetical protein
MQVKSITAYFRKKKLTKTEVQSMRGVIAINGSARNSGNTASLLQKALDGATLCGAETELVHLVDLNL